MAYQEQSIRGISNPLQSLLMIIYQLSYSYQTNQSFLPVSKTQMPYILIEEIDPLSPSERKWLMLSECMQINPHSAGATTCMEMNDLDSHTCSLSALTSYDDYQAMVESNNSAFLGGSPSSEIQNWQLHLFQLTEWLAYTPMTLSIHEYVFMSLVQIPGILASLNTYALAEGSLTWYSGKTNYKICFPLHKPNPASKGKRHVQKKILYGLREDIGVITKFSIVPLDKAKMLLMKQIM